jgi:hypothetical protein
VKPAILKNAKPVKEILHNVPHVPKAHIYKTIPAQQTVIKEHTVSLTMINVNHVILFVKVV